MDNKKLGLRTFFNDQKQSDNKSGVDSQNDKPTNETPNHVNDSNATIKKLGHLEKDKKSDLPVVAPVKIFNDLKKPKDKIVLVNKEEESAIQQSKPTENIEIIDSENNLGNATIITDTKKIKFNLFSTIAESLKKTFIKVKNRKPPEEKYKVADTSVRKEIVQKATSQSGKNVASDYKSAQELIKQRIEKDSKEKQKIWTPNTEAGYALLKSSTETAEQPKNIPSTNFYIEQRDIVVNSLNNVLSSGETASRWSTDTSKESPLPNTPKPIPESPKVEEVVIEKTIEDIPKSIPKPIPAPIPTKTQTILKDTPATTKTSSNKNVSKQEDLNKTIPLNNLKSNSDLKKKFYNTNTNTLSFAVAGVIFAIILFSGLGNFLLKTNEDPTKITTANLPKVINSDLNFVFQPILNKASIIDRIHKENSESEKINQFVFTTEENNENIIKPSNLMSYLRFRSGNNFNGSVNSIFFGQVDQNKPFMILKITDIDTAKGGMLKWEQFLYQDLNGILNSKSTSSDDMATTSDSLSTDFKDGMISSVDVRFLEFNDRKIIYGFVNDNTIIITNSNESFGELLELIQI